MLMVCVRLEHPHSTKRLGNIRRSYKGKGVSTIKRCTHLTVDGSSFTSLNKHTGLIGTTGALMSRQRKHVGVCTLHYLYDVCGSIGLTGTSNVGSSTYTLWAQPMVGTRVCVYIVVRVSNVLSLVVLGKVSMVVRHCVG